MVNRQRGIWTSVFVVFTMAAAPKLRRGRGEMKGRQCGMFPVYLKYELVFIEDFDSCQ
jgi:hypothetical protein